MILHLLAGIVGGFLAGAVLGFGAALIAMSLDGSPREGGTFGMMEVFTMVPSGAILGVVAGVIWAVRRGA